MDGARRLGRLARLLSIVSIVLGVVLIVVFVIVSGTENKGHLSVGWSLEGTYHVPHILVAQLLVME